MATLNYTLIDCKSFRLIILPSQEPHLKRLRLSIAPSLKARGAVGNRFGGAGSAALHASAAIATRHEVPLSNLVIRALTKSNYLIKGGLK